MARTSVTRATAGGTQPLCGAGRPATAGVRVWLRAVAVALALGLVGLPSPSRALETLDFDVPGASAELLADLRASSLLLSAQAEGRTAPIDLMAAARAEYGQLLDLLYEDGRYAPTIHVRVDGREAADVSPLRTPARIDRIAVQIDLGPQFTFGTASIAPLAPGATLPAEFAPGQPARSTVVRDALRAALDGWRAQGHALAEPAGQRVVADHNTNRLNISLTLSPGPQLHVGRVVPEGNQRTRDERIQAIAGLEPGSLHDPAAITAAETRLRQTGTFASVVLRTADHANADGTIDIAAQVEEAPPRRIGFGAELDSESGGRLSGFWLHRNLLGGADRLRLEAAVDGIAARTGGLGFSLDARYIRPATLNRDTDLELGFNAVRQDERDYQADAFTAEGLLRRRFSHGLSATAGVSLRYEQSTYGGVQNDFGTLGLPVSITQDTRDVALDATQGHYLWAEAMPYAGFGQAASGIRLRFDGRAYTDVGTGGRVVLAGRAQLGALFGPSLAAAPRGFLFYSGGGGSVRGMPYQSLGVAGPPASGGRGFAALSGEVRVRVNDSFSVVAFADAGAVSSGAFTGSHDWQAGAGLGVRYATPIGPLRLDLAAPVRRNAGATGNAMQIYFGIGQAF